jgi:hypothetical protein
MTELDFDFVIRFLINIGSILVLCYGCYYRINKDAEVAGSFVLFGVGIFIITRLLHGVDMSMEFAFGLFAVFTMLRYRTETISIKGMTYLFLVTGIALLTAVSDMPLLQIIMLNIVLCLIAFVVDSKLLSGSHNTKLVTYERIENIKPQNRDNLIKDLCDRTGLKVVSVSVLRIDFLRDTAELNIYYLPENSKDNIFSVRPAGL